MKLRELTKEEEAVILRKGTEPPFTGRYVKHSARGTYQCKRCGAPLFGSSSKFESNSGWPSFDEALPGAVREVPDADGQRTEIVCARCGAHLGHVFRGERFTPRNTRHCVNSISLTFKAAATPAAAEAFFAGGCFWGVEHHFEKQPGVIRAESGYMGGHQASPTYEQVCTGKTGHAETVRVVYDPKKTTYRELARLFFEIHDPTQLDRQGPDTGTQYRSAVFFQNEEEKKTVDELIGILQKQGLRVATRVAPATRFWKAEDYHQDYYQRSGKAPYCHARVKRFPEL